MTVMKIGQGKMQMNICILSNPADSRIGKLALDLFPILPIIGRNTYIQMNSLFVLSLIVIVIVVLIIKDPVSVRMATVRVKK